jgi:KaiC/GvpD/RAD55 family RecA-like ATPase
MGNEVVQKEIGWATCLIPDTKKLKAEKMLMGALLREPFNLSQHIGRLGRVALSNAGEKLGVAFLELLDQFSEYGNYSSITIEQKTGVDVSYFASTDSEIDLAWAVEIWWHEYSIYAEATALQHGVSESVAPGGVEAMRAAVEAARDKYGLNAPAETGNHAENFVTWGMNKLEGKEVVYIVQPHSASLRGVIHAFEPGDLWLIGARPSAGKTQFSMNLLSWFYDSGAKGLYFSLEMSGTSLLKRLLGIRHGIDPRDNWQTLDKQTVGRALSETASIAEGAIKIIDNAFTLHEIEAAAISAHYRGELEFVVIDYIGLILGRGNSQNREREVSGISAALKRLAKRLNVPVIALSQFSRALETRGGSKRPQLSDLRDSGSLEQDADGVIFLYRPEYHGITEDENGNSVKGIGEVIVAKHRNGPLETVKMSYTPIRGFRDIIPESKLPTSAPVDFTLPASARPEADEKIPF